MKNYSQKNHESKIFIEIVPIQFTGSVGNHPKEDYFAIPANIMYDAGYSVKILSTPSSLKGIVTSKNESNTRKQIPLLTIKTWPKYLSFLWTNRKAIIFANDRTPKSFIACFFGRRTVFMSHQSRNPPIWWQRQVFRFFVNRFDAIKVSNPFEKEELIKLGVKPEKIRYIPLSIDHEFFAKKSSEKLKDQTRKKYGIQKDEKVFLFLAHIRKFKRVATALRAMRILKDKNIKFKFIVVGNDLLHEENEKNVLDIAKELKIVKEVIMTGGVDPKQAREIMNISDICINSSIHEGQCLVVY
ncbi:MAG: glycosyltransferase family 4 protein, partial [Candidatus Woesearchaeota archaeon]